MQIPHSHPLDKLINDDRLFLLEAILPFIDSPMRMPLALYLKTTELKLIMNALNNKNYINQCDFNRNINNQDDVLNSLSQCGFPDIASQMKNLKSTMEMMKVMNMMNETTSNMAGNSATAKAYQSIFDEYDSEQETMHENAAMTEPAPGNIQTGYDMPNHSDIMEPASGNTQTDYDMPNHSDITDSVSADIQSGYDIPNHSDITEPAPEDMPNDADHDSIANIFALLDEYDKSKGIK